MTTQPLLSSTKDVHTIIFKKFFIKKNSLYFLKTSTFRICFFKSTTTEFSLSKSHIKHFLKYKPHQSTILTHQKYLFPLYHIKTFFHNAHQKKKKKKKLFKLLSNKLPVLDRNLKRKPIKGSKSNFIKTP
jgi:hypothetical protein